MKKVKHQSKRKVEDILRSAEDHPIIDSNDEELEEIVEELELVESVTEETVEELVQTEEIIVDETPIIEEMVEFKPEETMDIIENNDTEVETVEVNSQEDISVEETINETEEDEKKSGFWGMFKKQVIDEEIELIEEEPKVQIKEEKSVMSYSSKQSGYTSDSAAIVSASMVITGDVELETSLVISGKIVGNVVCKDTVESKQGGSIVGNLSALSAEFVGGSVKGNITVDEKIVIDEETVIEGDVKAKDIVISGKVIGEIKAENTVRLTSSANIKGDLYAASINIESGAKLDGRFVVQQ